MKKTFDTPFKWFSGASRAIFLFHVLTLFYLYDICKNFILISGPPTRGNLKNPQKSAIFRVVEMVYHLYTHPYVPWIILVEILLFLETLKKKSSSLTKSFIFSKDISLVNSILLFLQQAGGLTQGVSPAYIFKSSKNCSETMIFLKPSTLLVYLFTI